MRQGLIGLAGGIIILFLALGFLGCNGGHRLIKTEGIKNVTVHVNKTVPNADSFNISDKEQIAELMNLINSSEKEIIKFFASHSIQIQYEDTVRTIVVLNDLCKIDGISYRMKDNVNKYLHE